MSGVHQFVRIGAHSDDRLSDALVAGPAALCYRGRQSGRCPRHQRGRAEAARILTRVHRRRSSVPTKRCTAAASHLARPHSRLAIARGATTPVADVALMLDFLAERAARHHALKQMHVALVIGMVAGEASGDLLALLLSGRWAARPNVRSVGIGGPRWRRMDSMPGGRQKLAVNGVVEVLRHYREIVGHSPQAAERLLVRSARYALLASMRPTSTSASKNA